MTEKLKSAFISNETLLVTSKAGFHWSASRYLNSAGLSVYRLCEEVHIHGKHLSFFCVFILNGDQSMKKRNCSLWEQNLLFKGKHPLLVPINIYEVAKFKWLSTE